MSDNLQLSQGGCFAFNSGALANGTNAGTIKTTVAITYTIDGQFKSKSITDNIAISYTGPSVYQAAAGGVQAVNGSFTGGANGSTRLYLLLLDGSGNVSLVPGAIVDSADLAAGRAPLMFPDAPRNQCAFGVMRIALTAGTVFLPGTTALGAAGVTTTYINLSSAPGEPLTS